MEVLSPKKEQFDATITCACGAVLKVSQDDLKCDRLRAPDMPDWYPIYVRCAECGSTNDFASTNVPKLIREALYAAANLAYAQSHPPLSVRIKRWFGRVGQVE